MGTETRDSNIGCGWFMIGWGVLAVCLAAEKYIDALTARAERDCPPVEQVEAP